MCAYKPPVVKKAAGPQGKAKVQISTKTNKIRILLKDADTDETSEFILDLDEQGDEIQAMVKPGTWFIRLSGDKKKIYTIKPWEGMYEMKFVKFAAEKGKDPAPKKDLKFDTLFFLAVFEVVSGDAKGMQLVSRFKYAFAPVEDDGKTVAGLDGNMEWKGKITNVGKLAEFLDILGIWDGGPLPYRDNLLPAIEKRALRVGNTFKAVVKNGNIDSIFGSDDEPESEEIEDSEE